MNIITSITRVEVDSAMLRLSRGDSVLIVARALRVSESRLRRECRRLYATEYDDIMREHLKTGKRLGWVKSRKSGPSVFAEMGSPAKKKPPWFRKPLKSNGKAAAQDARIDAEINERAPVRRLRDFTPEELERLQVKLEGWIRDGVDAAGPYLPLSPFGRVE